MHLLCENRAREHKVYLQSLVGIEIGMGSEDGGTSMDGQMDG